MAPFAGRSQSRARLLWRLRQRPGPGCGAGPAAGGRPPLRRRPPRRWLERRPPRVPAPGRRGERGFSLGKGNLELGHVSERRLRSRCRRFPHDERGGRPSASGQGRAEPSPPRRRGRDSCRGVTSREEGSGGGRRAYTFVRFIRIAGVRSTPPLAVHS